MAPVGKKKKLNGQPLSTQVETIVYKTENADEDSEGELSIAQMKQKLRKLKKEKKKNEMPQIQNNQLICRASNAVTQIELPSTSSNINFSSQVRIPEANQLSVSSEGNLELEDNLPAIEQITEEEDQYYGVNYPDDAMVHIGNNIYCRRRILKMAKGTSHRATHMARKLLEGVFKKPTLVRSTLSGMSPRAQGKEKQNVEMIQLDFDGRQAIVDYSIYVASQRGWTTQSPKEIERAMCQRLGEIRRSLSK